MGGIPSCQSNFLRLGCLSMSKEYPVANFAEYRASRNPYAEKIAAFTDDASVFSPLLGDVATEAHRGKWREYFSLPQTAFLNLELGAYHGETSHHLAHTNPGAAHLGIEWKHKQCFKAGKKARDQGLKNVSFLRANSARLPWMFASGEVDRVWVLFPDPWSKASQHKWRLLQPEFFQILAWLLHENKELMIKTDHPEYANFIKESIASVPYFSYLPQERAAAIWSLIPPTPFERIFLRQGLSIHSFSLVRNSIPAALPERVAKKHCVKVNGSDF